VRALFHILTPEQKEMRVNCCRDFVEMTDKDPDFIKAIVTDDETWYFIYYSQTKRQSFAWVVLNEARPTKVHQQK